MELNSGSLSQTFKGGTIWTPFDAPTLPNTPLPIYDINNTGSEQALQQMLRNTVPTDTDSQTSSMLSDITDSSNGPAGDVLNYRELNKDNKALVDKLGVAKDKVKTPEERLGVIADEFLAEANNIADKRRTMKNSFIIYKERRELRKRCAEFDFNNTYLDVIPEETTEEMALELETETPKQSIFGKLGNNLKETIRKHKSVKVSPDTSMSQHTGQVMTKERLHQISQMFCVENQVEATSRRMKSTRRSNKHLDSDTNDNHTKESITNKKEISKPVLKWLSMLKGFVFW